MGPMTTTLWVRLLQFLVTSISLGLAIAFLTTCVTSPAYIIGVIIVAIYQIIHLFILFIPPLLIALPIAVVIFLELGSLIAWIVLFVKISGVFGTYGDCTNYPTVPRNPYYTAAACRFGKTLIAFTLFDFLLATISLVLMFTFSVIPVGRAMGYGQYITCRRNGHIVGGIYSKLPKLDEEAAELPPEETPEEKAEEVAEEKVAEEVAEEAAEEAAKEENHKHTCPHCLAAAAEAAAAAAPPPPPPPEENDSGKSEIVKEIVLDNASVTGSKYYVVRIKCKPKPKNPQ